MGNLEQFGIVRIRGTVVLSYDLHRGKIYNIVAAQKY